MHASELKREQRFEKFIAVLIALTAIFTAVTTFLERISSEEADRFDRIAQTYSIQATTESINGEIRFSYDWQGAFQSWQELNHMITNAESLGDAERAASYRAARAQLNALSPLLNQPYHDETGGFTDALRYAADLYVVDSTRLWEKFENASQVSNRWDQIANIFVLQLTFYAVALSLFGLSTTVRSAIRWMFVGLAGLIVLFNLVWGAVMFFVPIEEIPDGAIDAYAEGIGLAYQEKHAQAIQAFDQALLLQPDYANAIYNRGYSRLSTGDYLGAAADFEATLAAGQMDISVLWNLGWTYYLIGDYDRAVSINQRALDADPSVIGIRLNQGLTMLAQGRISNAVAEYDLAMNETVRQVQEARSAGAQVPWSLWTYLDYGTADLQSLVDVLNDAPKPWTQAPARAAILGDARQIEATAVEQMRRIKEAAISLELHGVPPGPRGPMNTSAFTFVQEIYDQNGNFLEYVDASVNEFGIDRIGVLFDYSGFAPGQEEIWKVYINGVEAPGLRVVSTWGLEESGSAIKRISYEFTNAFVLSPGEYTMELYIDSHLLQTGTFLVLNP